MKYLIAGDSHTQYFGITTQLRALVPELRGVKAITNTVSASTISGVGKMNSTLKLGEDIQKWTEQHSPDFLVLNLGQVDVELGIPFRRFVKQSSEPTTHWLTIFLENYQRYISTLPIEPSSVILKGINLPVLCYDQQKAIKYINRIVTERFTEDGNADTDRTRILNDLKENYPSDIARTDLAVMFNEQLKSLCSDNGYGYFDVNSKLVGTNSGLIDPRFIPAKFDHHVIDSLEVRRFHWESLIELCRARYWK